MINNLLTSRPIHYISHLRAIIYFYNKKYCFTRYSLDYPYFTEDAKQPYFYYQKTVWWWWCYPKYTPR